MSGLLNLDIRFQTCPMSEQQNTDAAVAAAIDAWKDRPGPLLPLLHDIQHRLGHIPEQSVPDIAAALRLSRAEVHGVISFYPDFRLQPAGRHTVRICRAESCQARGSQALADRARQRLGLDWHETGADGRYTLEPVYCLGLCAYSPTVVVDGRQHAFVTPEKLDELLDGCEADK